MNSQKKRIKKTRRQKNKERIHIVLEPQEEGKEDSTIQQINDFYVFINLEDLI